MDTKLTPAQLQTQLKQHKENRNRLISVENEIIALKATVAANSELVNKIASDTEVLVTIFRNARSGVRVISFAAQSAKFVAMFFAGLAVIWTVIQAVRTLATSYIPGH